MTPKHILLTTDFSREARAAYPCVARLQTLFQSVVHLVHFQTDFYTGSDWHSGNQHELDDLLDVERNHLLQFGARAASCESRAGRLPTALQRVERQRGIDLIVAAKHRVSPIKRFILGSFVERLVRLASAPVLVVGGRIAQCSDEDPLRVVVPFDWSASSRASLPAVRFLRQNFSARFEFLLVTGPPRVRRDYFNTVFQAVGFAQPSLEERFAALRQDELPGVDACFLVREGAPAAEILHHATLARADLILLGTTRLVGSVAQAVVRDTSISTLVLPIVESAERAAAPRELAPH